MNWTSLFIFIACFAAIAMSAHAQSTQPADAKPSVTGINAAPAGRCVLWYRQPAGNWYEALPIGNGRLGAMIFGGVKTEHLQLNEDTIWSGGPYQPAQESSLDAIKKARDLIFSGSPAALNETTDLLYQKAFGRPIKEMSYLPLGDLEITLPDAAGEITDYARSLDLETATALTKYKIGDVTYAREVFASAPDQVIVARISADKPASVSFAATFVSPLNHFAQAADADVLTMTGNGTDYTKQNRVNVNSISNANRTIADADVKGCVIAHARVATNHVGGTVTVTDRGLTVKDADSVTLIIAAATNFIRYDNVSGDAKSKASAILSKASGKSYEQLKSAQLADYQSLFRRVSIDLGRTDAAGLPTNERIPNFSKGLDPDLAALYFQFGRYLLISSSRPGDG